MKKSFAITLAAMLRNPRVEAERWALQGSVDRQRLAWIAAQTRGVPPRTRRALAAQLAEERDRWSAVAKAPAAPVVRTAAQPAHSSGNTPSVARIETVHWAGH